IHVCVVDPGVGTQRNIIAVRASQHTFIGPDNGLLRWAVDDAATVGGDGADAADTRQIVRIEQPQYRLPVVSATFHGRDIMAPAAAHLANGVPLESLGAPLATLQGQPLPVPIAEAQRLRGSVMYIDRFGNCVTNIRLIEQAADFRRVRVSGVDLILRRTYADVAAGEPLALIGSSGFLEIAVRNGNAQEQLGLKQGSEVRIGP
ncbi:MAG TPA: SAM-dependent chlorinase/fluorinase, partial [Chloroflexota bacterium]|nr:SAM-dependent chlorinase/fluorinase [Chloroflexota bacterium]